MAFAKAIRIEPAFQDREEILAMFERNAPYRAVAVYAPGGINDQRDHGTNPSISAWFRGDWALAGKPLVEGAELILHNPKFIEAAKAAFSTSYVNPEFVVVNINGPMPAGARHVDNASFYGATRVEYPLPILRVMGSSGLFEPWRVVRASTLSWFYEGPGGNFDYWPEGIDGPMLSERPPFGNFALCADTDRIHHRIGRVGNEDENLPQISASAVIQPDGEGNWLILEDGEVCAIYPNCSIRFSVLWKAEVRERQSNGHQLTLDRIMDTFTTDLRRRNVQFKMPSNPLTDREWILLLQRVYADTIDSAEKPSGVINRIA